jgi:hypothetical protein
MTSPIIYPPTLSDFIAWTRTYMGIPTTAIPDNDPGYAISYQIALDLVPENFATYSPDIYTLTVYNWGGSQLLQTQPDITGQTFFADARKAYNLNSFVGGVISSANDVSTGETLAVGVGLQNLTLLDLQRIKDPYGRQAIAYMQTLGTLWGIN